MCIFVFQVNAAIPTDSFVLVGHKFVRIFIKVAFEKRFICKSSFCFLGRSRLIKETETIFINDFLTLYGCVKSL